MDIGETLYVTTPAEFRRWLKANHKARTEIWLVQYKKATRKPSITLDQALDEAVCFGWIDSYMKGIDAEKYATRFSPRRPRSNWTQTNRDRARRLIAEGKMTQAGLAALPEDLKAH
ncbi:MAG TPA: hypothetical protein VMJ64_11250 [Anaerolineales bacterium]|nr:hypothetical protein [Anaerolineales bacterium]